VTAQFVFKPRRHAADKRHDAIIGITTIADQGSCEIFDGANLTVRKKGNRYSAERHPEAEISVLDSRQLSRLRACLDNGQISVAQGASQIVSESMSKTFRPWKIDEPQFLPPTGAKEELEAEAKAEAEDKRNARSLASQPRHRPPSLPPRPRRISPIRTAGL
jgi:hypothetical protein